MRILHTSDWHLGASLKEHPRDYEHGEFLRWLTATLQKDAYDAILIAGDIFDSANPPARALQLWYGWLTSVVQLLPTLQIIVIGGNHDSASRLNAPAELLRALRIHTVGGLERLPDGRPDISPTIVALRDSGGEIRALVGAVPFLGTVSTEAVSDCYGRMVDQLRATAPPAAALMLTGHLTALGSALQRSTDSERAIAGSLENVPVAVFPDDVAYVALGHLHRAQQPAERVWYSGSPIPMSFAEQDYEHRVLSIELVPSDQGRSTATVSSIPIPRSVPMETWPAKGEAMSAADAMFRLQSVAAARDVEETLPLVQIRLSAGTAVHKRELDEAAHKRDIRLLHVDIGRAAKLGPGSREVLSLDDPRAVFVAAWSQSHGDRPIPAGVWAAYDEAVDAYRAGAVT